MKSPKPVISYFRDRKHEAAVTLVLAVVLPVLAYLMIKGSEMVLAGNVGWLSYLPPVKAAVDFLAKITVVTPILFPVISLLILYKVFKRSAFFYPGLLTMLSGAFVIFFIFVPMLLAVRTPDLYAALVPIPTMTFYAASIPAAFVGISLANETTQRPSILSIFAGLVFIGIFVATGKYAYAVLG